MSSNYLVYRIQNLINKKVYIGSTTVGKSRIFDQLDTLRKNKHYNEHFQSSFNKYGENNFRGIVWEECNESNYLDKEQWWMDYYQSFIPKFGYNIKKVVIGGMPAPVHSQIMRDYWKTVTPEKKNSQVSGIIPNWENEEYRAKMLPVSLAKVIRNNERRKIDPEFDKLCNSGLDKHNSRPDISDINSKKKKIAWENPEYQKEHSEMMINVWKRPGFRENHIMKIKAAAERKRQEKLANKDIVSTSAKVEEITDKHGDN